VCVIPDRVGRSPLLRRALRRALFAHYLRLVEVDLETKYYGSLHLGARPTLTLSLRANPRLARPTAAE